MYTCSCDAGAPESFGILTSDRLHCIPCEPQVNIVMPCTQFKHVADAVFCFLACCYAVLTDPLLYWRAARRCDARIMTVRRSSIRRVVHCNAAPTADHPAAA